MINKFLEISRAWIKAANPSGGDIKIAEYRISVCNECEEKKKNNKIIGFYYCQICKCPLNKKIFSDNKNSCPKYKWEK